MIKISFSEEIEELKKNKELTEETQSKIKRFEEREYSLSLEFNSLAKTEETTSGAKTETVIDSCYNILRLKKKKLLLMKQITDLKEKEKEIIKKIIKKMEENKTSEFMKEELEELFNLFKTQEL